MLKNLLLHPKATLTALVAGLLSLSALLVAVAVAIGPLQSTPGLDAIRPYVGEIVVVCGTASGVCLALAAVGRSIVSFIDNLNTPASTPEKGPST